jgi:hypothetical protein
MRVKSFVTSHLWLILMLFLTSGWGVACTSTETEAEATIHTWLLVRAPDRPLLVGNPLIVKSRSEAPEVGVSHIELYLVEFRSPDNTNSLDNILIRSDAAPFQQTTFTAEQQFEPEIPGHYVIKVVGYDKLGGTAESEYIGFEVIPNDE